MHFKLVVEPHSKSIYLEPENPGEEQLLTALLGGWNSNYDEYQYDSEPKRTREARVIPTWSQDSQSSYKRCLIIKVTL